MSLNQGLTDLVAVAPVAALAPLVVTVLSGPRIPQVVILLLGGVLIALADIGQQDGVMLPATSASLVGAGVLSVLIYSPHRVEPAAVGAAHPLRRRSQRGNGPP